MRKIICISCFVLLILSCTTIGELNVINDDIKNARSASIEITDLFSEEKAQAQTFRVNQKIVKEINADGTFLCTIFFTIRASVRSYGIEKKYFIKTNNATYDSSIENVEEASKSETHTSERQVYKSDSTDPKEGHWETVTDVSTSSWKEYRLHITLTPEIVSDIVNSDQIIVRFYSAGNPVTFVYKDKIFDALLSVLNYN